MSGVCVSHSTRLARLYTFPIRKHIWVYHVERAASLNPSGSGGLGLTASAPSRADLGSLSFIDRLRERGKRLSHKLFDKVESEWKELSVAPDGSWKRKFHSFCQRHLLDRQDPLEQFLKAVPSRQAGVLDVSHPSNFTDEAIARRLYKVAAKRFVHHKRWMNISIALVPLSILGGILPGPNVFLLWNGYRIHAHWRAACGAEALVKAFDCGHFVPGTAEEAVPEFQTSTRDKIDEFWNHGRSVPTPEVPHVIFHSVPELDVVRSIEDQLGEEDWRTAAGCKIVGASLESVAAQQELPGLIGTWEHRRRYIAYIDRKRKRGTNERE